MSRPANHLPGFVVIAVLVGVPWVAVRGCNAWNNGQQDKSAQLAGDASLGPGMKYDELCAALHQAPSATSRESSTLNDTYVVFGSGLVCAHFLESDPREISNSSHLLSIQVSPHFAGSLCGVRPGETPATIRSTLRQSYPDLKDRNQGADLGNGWILSWEWKSTKWDFSPRDENSEPTGALVLDELGWQKKAAGSRD